jgi:F0F1-type ATP synthase membrane subunit b/b'
MERFIHRIPDRDAGDEGSEEAPAHAESVGAIFLPHDLLERREGLSPRRKKRQADGQGSEAALGDFAAVGRQVATVLAAAQQAAEEIRQEATREGEHIRAEADAEAGRVRANASDVLRDAERQRSEAEKYVAETRAAADSYADEKQREAENEAEKIKARAEREGRAIIKAAERRGTEIEEVAQRRGEELDEESMKVEEWLRKVLSASQTVSEDLEGVLETKQGTDLTVTYEWLDEAPKQRSAESASPSRATGADAPRL